MTNCTYTLKPFDNGDMLRYSPFLTSTPHATPIHVLDLWRVQINTSCGSTTSSQITCVFFLFQLRHHRYHFPAARKGDVTRNVNLFYSLMVRVMLPGTSIFFIHYCNGQTGWCHPERQFSLPTIATVRQGDVNRNVNFLYPLLQWSNSQALFVIFLSSSRNHVNQRSDFRFY